MRTLGLVAALVTIAAPARAQSINVSFGPAGTNPSASYAGAGGAGMWNGVTGISGSTFSLVGIDGAPSTVTMSQSPTTTLITTSDPSITGDDALLLNNGLVTSSAETCLAFSGFQPGRYEVLVYAWLPNQPGVKSRTRQDEAASTIDVGGVWTGVHIEGVSYARYTVDVGTDGTLPAHSGLVPGAPAAALNGVQIRLVPANGQPDAGVGGGGDTGDAGTDVTSSHGGGCNAAGGAGPAVVFAFGFVRRRRRR